MRCNARLQIRVAWIALGVLAIQASNEGAGGFVFRLADLLGPLQVLDRLGCIERDALIFGWKKPRGPIGGP